MQVVAAVEFGDADVLCQAVALGQVVPVRGEAFVAFDHEDGRSDARDEFLDLFFGEHHRLPYGEAFVADKAVALRFFDEVAPHQTFGAFRPASRPP